MKYGEAQESAIAWLVEKVGLSVENLNEFKRIGSANPQLEFLMRGNEIVGAIQTKIEKPDATNGMVFAGLIENKAYIETKGFPFSF